MDVGAHEFPVLLFLHSDLLLQLGDTRFVGGHFLLNMRLRVDEPFLQLGHALCGLSLRVEETCALRKERLYETARHHARKLGDECRSRNRRSVFDVFLGGLDQFHAVGERRAVGCRRFRRKNPRVRVGKDNGFLTGRRGNDDTNVLVIHGQIRVAIQTERFDLGPSLAKPHSYDGAAQRASQSKFRGCVEKAGHERLRGWLPR